jgi:hypothetical protein
VIAEFASAMSTGQAEKLVRCLRVDKFEPLAKFKKLKFYEQNVVFFDLQKQYDVPSLVKSMNFACSHARRQRH